MSPFSLMAVASLGFLHAHAQQAGNYGIEKHPALSWQQCTTGGGCRTVNGRVVIDAEWRWLHRVGDLHNCYTGNSWDPSTCPDNKKCTQNCVIEGVEDYSEYGISTSGSTLMLRHRALTSSQHLGSRVYLLGDNSTYQTFNLLDQEFSVDVDVSSLPCDINGAVSFLQMDVDGGMKRFPSNTAGAQYGTGYCNARCPKNLRFINGEVLSLSPGVTKRRF